MTFNPFGKGIGDALDAADLQVLVDRQIAEGYYIEYKSDFQTTTKIAKSLASFANTYGGWYFLGIQSDKTTSIAMGLPGFDLTDHPDPIATVRNVARDHIDPMPLLFPQLVEMTPGHWILAVYVPESNDTPHVCSDGRIYRRAADSSDPVFEKDRYTLDRLVERGKEALHRFDEFCIDDRTFSKSEKKRSWFEGYFAPYPVGSVQTSNVFETTDLEALIDLSKGPLTSPFLPGITVTLRSDLTIPYQVQTGFGSVLIRWLEPSQSAFNTLQIELFADGRCRMAAPLTLLNAWQPGTISSRLTQEWLYSMKSDPKTDVYMLKFIDLRSTWGLLSWMVTVYTNWLQKLNWQGEVWTRMRLTNVWRCVPFYDTDAWMEHVQKFGVPVSHRDTIEMPTQGQRPLQVSLTKEGGLGILLSFVGLALGVPIGSLWAWIEERARAENTGP